MKGIAVFPGKPGSLHLAELPKPSVGEVPGGRGVLVWLRQLLTYPVRGLDNYRQLFGTLANGRGAIKVFCEVAEP